MRFSLPEIALLETEKREKKTGEKQIKKVREERKVYEKCVSYSSWHCLENKSLAF